MENKIIEVIILLSISGLWSYASWRRSQEDKRKKSSKNLSKEIYNRIKSQFDKN